MKTPDELLNKHAKIQPNELRVGNWLKGIGHNIIWKIEGVHEDFIFSKNAWRILSSFEPIPLTEEWLVKFGFDSEGIGNEAHLNMPNGIPSISNFSLGCHIPDPDNPDYWFDFFIHEQIPNDDEHASFIPFKTRFVHQLQNLYFALTNEELTYTP